jgi:RNA recognition motif-containing protein
MTIFVGNLNYLSTADDLTEFFNEKWHVQSVSIPTDRESGRAKGIAFVNLGSPEEEEEAIATANGTEFMGRALRLDRAKSRQ